MQMLDDKRERKKDGIQYLNVLICFPGGKCPQNKHFKEQLSLIALVMWSGELSRGRVRFPEMAGKRPRTLANVM